MTKALIENDFSIYMATITGRRAWERIIQAIKTGVNPKASDLKMWAESQQGWYPTQTPNGPLKYIDKNGIIRVTLKQGSPRAPGSNHPHVELRNPQGIRINLLGNPVSRRSSDNHTAIDWDI